MTRKPRLRTLPSASYSGSAPTFAPTRDEWRQIGGTFCDLSDEDERRITDMVVRYLRDAPFESHVHSVNKVVDRLELICKAAGRLYEVLAHDYKGGSSEVGSIALEHLEVRLRVGLPHCFSGEETSLGADDASTLAASIMVAAKLAKQDVMQDPTPGIQVHDAWRKLVLDLMDWAEQRRLSVTTAKKAETSKNWPSPFVQFFSRLQDALPPDAREFCGNGPLTDALADVRGRRKAKKNTVRELSAKNSTG
ncbi:hypothetical protein [Methylocapsa aurea]|uniref:hypothetical protein n=1 Tax=Methylocapsa aurea TaxID=663610 RepID=UPI000564FC54|nr:hypothetical protein [Methylocapsa aurea]